MKDKALTEKKFNPHFIRTKIIRDTKWSAFVTWSGLDLQEYGETQRNAVLFLLQRHSKALGISEDRIPELLKQIGFF
jgi:hypothetical protein